MIERTTDPEFLALQESLLLYGYTRPIVLLHYPEHGLRVINGFNRVWSMIKNLALREILDGIIPAVIIPADISELGASLLKLADEGYHPLCELDHRYKRF